MQAAPLPPQTPGRSTPDQSAIKRSGRKFNQVLEGARKVFMAAGFERANVDDIAHEAGVSKATLYSYFPDKAALFSEVARCECDRLAEAALEEIDINAPLREVLGFAATRIATVVLSGFSQSMFSICVAERARFPALARSYYEAGPEMGRKQIEAYLRVATEAGQLDISDFTLASEQFTDLARTRLWLRAVFGVQAEFSSEEIASVAEEAVETFLARYAT
ncbi:TetR/AcrR family transcriptional regulator [Aquicoccus sp. G2-2]|uniref:TetR/AcrR family transcriptional regulator n=1 Tax=Aquicoccus sp. G2-2 TaxID=3092120 RepID=UPI002ADF41D6|nr:TetR/AcrR family transcriptional regulator [Aquicoccus sp. G2-2]MEA1114664.1 TetR/AcrR family transcriptional regulator [Aquicoccus sp. G2-2]